MMKNQLKISVIVPVYNLEDCIENCLKTIQNQTYRNLEIIVVDDGSTDGSRKIIERFAMQDRRIIPFFKENGGVTTARLFGIQKATGKWIGFVDGDDEIEEDMFEILLNNAEKYGADISHCGYKMNFQDGRVNYFYNTGRLVIQDRKKGLTDLLEGTYVEPGLWNKLFRKELFEKILENGSIDTRIRINEDLLMNFFLFSLSKKSVFIDQCKYIYKVRSNSATRKEVNINHIYDPVKVKEIILQNAPSEILTCAQTAYINTCINTYNMLLIKNKKALRNDVRKIKKLLLEKKEWIGLLRKRKYISAKMILHVPNLYAFFYKIYYRFFFRSRYQ